MVLPACALLLAIAAPSRAVIAGPVEAELWSRIRGQTSDLDWAIEQRPRDPELDLLAWASTIEAEAVLAIERQPRAWDVSLIGRARERRLIRRVDVGATDAAESSAREAVAVIVRGMLIALALGAPVALESTEAAWSPFVMVGAEGTWAGAALGGVRARGGLQSAPWSIALGVVSGPARALDDGRTVLSLARHAIALHAGAAWALSDRWSVGGSIALGAAAFQRSVVVQDPTLTGTEPRLRASFLGGVEAALRWQPTSLGVELSLGLDVVPSAPELVYRVDDQAVVRTSVSVLEPRLALSLVLGGGR